MPAVYEAALAPLLSAGCSPWAGAERFLVGGAATERSWLAMPRYTAGLTGRAGTEAASNKEGLYAYELLHIKPSSPKKYDVYELQQQLLSITLFTSRSLEYFPWLLFS